jgi:hypothetical protein
MQCQVFVQNPTDRTFMASVVGLSSLTANGITEKEVIDLQNQATHGLPTWRFFKMIRHLMNFSRK